MPFSISEKNRLKAKYGSWALITGSSSGIGKEIAERLAEAGLNLVLVARQKKILEEISLKLKSQYNIEVLVIDADLSKIAEIEKVIEKTSSIDIGLLVPSAGFGTSGLFVESSLKEEVNMIEVNCIAPLILVHHFSQKFKIKKRGGIILMSSLVSFQGVPFSANYAATKAYIQSLAEALHEELKPYGIDILAAAPGPVESGFGNRSNMKMGTTLNPADIGIPILKALGRRTTVLPGLLTKVLTYSLRTVPRWGKVKIMKTVMGGFTKHQRTK